MYELSVLRRHDIVEESEPSKMLVQTLKKLSPALVVLGASLAFFAADSTISTKPCIAAHGTQGPCQLRSDGCFYKKVCQSGNCYYEYCGYCK